MTDSKQHRGWIGKLFGGRRARPQRQAPARPAGEDPRAWARPEELVDLSSLPPHVAEDMVATAALIDEADRARERGDREQAEELLRGAVGSTVDPYRQLAEERLGTLLSENGEVEEAIALWLRAAGGPDPGLRQAVEVYLGSIPFADPGFLVRADPATMLTLLPRAWGPGRLGAAVYQASAHRHRDAPAAVRRHLLALDAARYGDLDLAARIDAVPVPDEPAARRRVEWASGVQLGGCHLAGGRTEEALRHLGLAVRAWEECGYRRGVALAYISLGEIALRQREPERAVPLFARARRILTEVADPHDATRALAFLGRAHAQGGEHALGMGEMREALAAFSASGALHWQARTLEMLGHSAREHGDEEEARDHLAQARSRYELTSPADARRLD